MATSNGDHGEYDPVPVQSPDQHTSRKDENTSAAWGIGWWCPSLMVGFFICGAMLAMGHHLYYRSLNNTLVHSVDEQTWAIRIGTGFAYLVKTSLVSAVGIAAAQVTWATVRRTNVKLSGIDGMFAILNDPMSFLLPELWMHAKILTLLAIVSWLIPLTAVVTPATLSVHLLTTSNITQLRVPTVNFTESFWIPWATYVGAGYIGSPSPAISRLFTATSSYVDVLPSPAPFPNSSYTLAFWAPSYQCQRLSEALVDNQGRTFTDHLDNHYSSLQNLWNHEIGNETNLTRVIYSATAPRALNNSLFVYAAGSNPLWNDNATQPTELVCQLWNTSYVVHLNFTDGVRTLTPISTDPVAPANWSFTAGSQSTLNPQGPDVNGGYHITHLLFSGLMQRTLVTSVSGELTSFEAEGLQFTTMSITQTGLFGCPELWNSSTYQETGIVGGQSVTTCRNRTLARALEDLSRNFTYSLLSLNAANTTVPVTVASAQNFYSYSRTNLFIAYMTAVAVTLVCVLVGFHALWSNGVPHSTSFSSVLVTTRNPELDHLAFGHCLGSDPLDKEVGKVRLRFGEIEGAREYRHAAFGTKGSVTALSKGKEYY
ncbi:hypothetical protein BDW62DRAFT_206992 [Aspergillus aurantiobrunneus]